MSRFRPSTFASVLMLRVASREARSLAATSSTLGTCGGRYSSEPSITCMSLRGLTYARKGPYREIAARGSVPSDAGDVSTDGTP